MTDKEPSPLHFHELVTNAADFLERSVKELRDGELKYSVIHFAQAIELFVKARLLCEHWSLIIARPEQADLDEFESSGNFQTVNLRDAVQRLKSIAKDDMTEQFRSAFDPIMRHRNRVIHFHHPEYSHAKPIASDTQCDSSRFDKAAAVVGEQCLAWYELHSLLTGRWSGHFREYLPNIERLHRLMLELRPYLEQRFQKLSGHIKMVRDTGVEFGACPSCGYEASERSIVFGALAEARCLVCQEAHREYRFPCLVDGCGGSMVLREYKGAACDKCGYAMDASDALGRLRPSYHPKDGEDFGQAFCSECESYEVQGGSVAKIDGEHYLCTVCLANFDGIGQCGWCNENIAGGIEEVSFYFGCMMCEGHAGWRRDDD